MYPFRNSPIHPELCILRLRRLNFVISTGSGASCRRSRETHFSIPNLYPTTAPCRCICCHPERSEGPRRILPTSTAGIFPPTHPRPCSCLHASTLPTTKERHFDRRRRICRRAEKSLLYPCRIQQYHALAVVYLKSMSSMQTRIKPSPPKPPAPSPPPETHSPPPASESHLHP
jgi:hypothetical protein